MTKLRDKKLGTLIGLAVGDAMGAPYEFKYRSHYKATKEYNTGGAHNVDKGEWTDDTSMALCLAQSLIDKNGFDPIDQMDKYLMWYRNGYMCTRKRCFDIGTATRNSIYAFEQSNRNIAYTKTGSTTTNGNGTIMRLAPISMFFTDDILLLEYAKKSSLTTHRGIDAYKCAMLLAEIINNCYNFDDKFTIIENTKNLEEVGYNLSDLYVGDEGFHPTIPTGYCVDTLHCAIQGFLYYDNFIDGLMYCISQGDDTDTVGAVYGQIAGAYYGLSGISDYYKENLMQYDKILDIGNKLVDLSESKTNNL